MQRAKTTMDRETEIRDKATQARGNKSTGQISSNLAKKEEMTTVDKIAHFGIFTMVCR